MVKHWDKRVLAREAIELMGVDPKEWGIHDEPAPIRGGDWRAAIEQWEAPLARKAFLQRARELGL